MSEQEAQILAGILEAIERGDHTPDEVLDQYPKLANELASLLDTVQLYQNYQIPATRANFRSAARARILSFVIGQEPVTFRTWLRCIQQNTTSIYERRPVMSIILIATLILSLLGGGTAYASQTSLPGDLLYAVKLTVEDALLSLSPEGRAADLSLQYAGERVEELKGLIEQQRYEDIPTATQRYQVQTEGVDPAALSVHVEVLTGLLDVVPYQARAAIEIAIAASSQQPEELSVELPDEGLPEELPVEIPAGFPPQVPVDLPPAVPDTVPPVTIPSAPPGEPPAPPVEPPTVPVIEPPVPPFEPPPVVPTEPPVEPPPVEPPADLPPALPVLPVPPDTPGGRP
jgi:hypothetical protein